MSMYQFEVSVRGPEGIMSKKTFDTTEEGAKKLVERIDRGVASHRLIEGIEEQPPTEAADKTASKKKPAK